MWAVAIFSDDSVHQVARRKTDELERLAFLDPVTRLPNRRYMEMCLRTALDQFHVHKDPFGVLMIDLDQFKAINDRFGHAIGDLALQEAGKTVSRELRGLDIVGRWGGDELMAVVYHVNYGILSELAARCCAMVGQTLVPSSIGAPVSLSVSIGGALALPDDLAEGLIERADGQMYQCKTSGRGRVAIG